MTAELLDQHGQPVRSKYLKGAPRGKWKPATPNQLRLVDLSMPNSGKTTFACSIPNCLVLDLAGHASMVPKIAPGSHVERVTEIETAMNIIEELHEQRKKKPWQTVVIDDGDIVMEQLIRWLSIQPKYNIGLRKGGVLDELWSITDYGERGKGWYIVRDEYLERMTDKLTLGGYGWVVNGNYSQKQRPEGDRVVYDYKPVMAASILDGLRRTAHYVLNFTMTYEVSEVKVGTKTTKFGERAIIEKRPTHRVFASVLPPSGDDDDRHAKARFIEHMPKDEDGEVTFEISRTNPWGSWVKVYLDAVKATAEEQGVELDESITKLLEPKPKKGPKP